MSYLWCNLMNNWCRDIDEEEHKQIGCDGGCKWCDDADYAEELRPDERY